MKRKIAIIGLKGLPAFGGAARVGESIINHLRDRYDFTVYSISSHVDMRGTHNGYKQIVFRSPKNHKINIISYYLRSAFHCIFRGQYDIVHLNHGNSGFILPLLKMRYLVISTLHGSGQNVLAYDKLGRIGKNMFLLTELLILKLSDVVTSVSKPHLRYYQNRVDRKIHYIPNGIELLKNVPENNVPFRKYILFAAGRIIPIKGCHIFVEALNMLNYSGKILIIGDLSQNPAYEKGIKALSRNLNVNFVGLIKDKALLMAYLKKAMLFVFPSYIEAMSNMLLEAASMSTPIVCSDIPENSAIFHKDEVLFFQKGDVADLAKKIQWSFDNLDDMRRKAKRARQKLLASYTWDTIAEEYDRLYQHLINRADLSKPVP